MINSFARTYIGKLFQGRSLDSISSVILDSRHSASDSVFFAVKGNNVDGRSYIPDAIKTGGLSICDSLNYAGKNDLHKYPSEQVCLVDNLQETILNLIQAVIVGLKSRGCKVICTTGSSGKTFATRSITKILADAGYNVFSNKGNLNTEYGLLLSLSKCPEELDYLVLELAVGTPGDMSLLAPVIKPDLSLVLDVQKAHLGDFGTNEAEAIEQLRKEKLKLVEYSGQSVVHANLKNCVEKYYPTARVSYYDPRQVTSDNVPNASGVLKLDQTEHRISFVHLYGDHYLENSVGIISILDGAVEIDQAIKSLENIESIKGRGDLRSGFYSGRHHFSVYDSSYNANPGKKGSMFRELEVMERFKGQGKDILLVLGEFVLAIDAKKEHKEALSFASTISDRIILVGKKWGLKAIKIVNQGNAKWVVKRICRKLRHETIVFVKGSNANGLYHYLMPSLEKLRRKKRDA